jgi:hypothetical protein
LKEEITFIENTTKHSKTVSKSSEICELSWRGLYEEICGSYPKMSHLHAKFASALGGFANPDQGPCPGPH